MRIDNGQAIILGIIWTFIGSFAITMGAKVELWQPLLFVGLIAFACGVIFKNK